MTDLFAASLIFWIGVIGGMVALKWALTAIEERRERIAVLRAMSSKAPDHGRQIRPNERAKHRKALQVAARRLGYRTVEEIPAPLRARIENSLTKG